ncbi:MAG: VIT domain-containing protein [Kiritimatiellae bacterium]|nr:VIT domain-containing protein [Kiritimatiellia bacterium]
MNETYVAGAMCGRAETGQLVVLPLKRTEVKIRVVTGVISSVVTQYFENTTNCPLEAVYIFPLPAEASVTDMEMKVGDRRIKSVVRKKVEAWATYEEAKNEGRAAALLDSERPNVFRLAVANFLPGETAAITFEYAEPMELRDGVGEVTFPMVVGERYFSVTEQESGEDTSPTGQTEGIAPDTGVAAVQTDFLGQATESAVSEARRINPPVLCPSVDTSHTVGLEVEILGIPVDRVLSKTHAIKVEPLGNFKWAYRVIPEEGELAPNCEFNLQIFVERADELTPTWVVSERGDVRYGLLTLFPPMEVPDEDQPPQDIVFVIDTSGSMQGSSLAEAKQALVQALCLLRPEDRFNIVRFDEHFFAMAENLVPADPGKIATAILYVESLVAMGGTEMTAALTHALDMVSSSTRDPSLFVFTDGCIAGESELLSHVRAKLGNARIFVFGMGSAPSTYLVEALAKSGRGDYRFIRSEEEAAEVIRDFMSVWRLPILGEFQVEWLGLDGERIKPREYYFTGERDILADRPVRIFVMFDGILSARLRLSGICRKARQEFVYLLDPTPISNVLVSRLFGRAKIDHLERQRWLDNLSEAQDRELVREITRTALEYQLVTPYTSRVAVEEKLVQNPFGALVTVTVPVPPPKGWAMFDTATQDVFHAGVGAGLILAAFAFSALRRRWT